MKLFVGNLIAFGILLVTLIMSGGLSIYFYGPSLIIVLLPALALSIGVTSLQAFKQAIFVMANIPIDRAQKNLQSIKQFFAVNGKVALLMGGLGVLIGIVHMGDNAAYFLEDTSRLGAAIGTCMLTLMYGIIIKVFCYVGEQKLDGAMVESGAWCSARSNYGFTFMAL